MTALTYRDGIAIFQLVAFFPCLSLSLFLCYKQGLKAVAACWRFLIILALLRIAGAICQMILIDHKIKDVFITKLVCDLLGIAPLTLACVGLLQRVNTSINKMPKHVFTFVSLVSLAGLGVGIAGAMKSVNGGNLNVTTLLQAALGLFIACLGLMISILLYLTYFSSLLFHLDKAILMSVHLCTPFLIVRMVYAALSDYSGNKKFGLLTGSPTIQLFMGVFPEVIIMIICLVAGFKYPPATQRKTGDVEHEAGSFSATSERKASN